MAETFSRIAHQIAAPYARPEIIHRAVEALGAKAELRVTDVEPERRLSIAEQFVRSLRNVGVSDSTTLQRDLFQALGVAPTSRRSVQVKDAISLIAIRNHLQQVTTSMGFSWGDGMRIQSAISDVARFLSQSGGGRIETHAEDESIHFDVWTQRPVSASSLERPGQTPAWLVATLSLARGFLAAPAHGGTHLSFTIDRQLAVAA